jgi:hypothetical protein
MLSKLVPGVAALLLPLPAPAGQEPTKVPPGTPVTITVTPAQPAAPPVSIVLKGRHGHATPLRDGCARTGGGNIDVAQPSPDTVVITMTGVAVATAHPKGSTATLTFELEQCFEVSFDKPEVKAAKLTIEGRVIGLLRSGCKKTSGGCKGGGTASTSGGCATVACGPAEVATVCVPDHEVAGCEDLALNDHAGPVTGPIAPGAYVLHQKWQVTAAHPQGLLGKAASAEFAPDPALDPLWISAKEPFHGAAKKDFGFQVTVRVAPDG